MSSLGRLIPKDFSHVAASPLRAIMPSTPTNVEKTLMLPTWIASHDQGDEGACVGFNTSLALSIINENQCRKQGDRSPYVRYNPWWLWREAKKIDGFTHTDPNDGTTVSAACNVLINVGHVLWTDETSPESCSDPDPNYGINAVRWATTVDQIRTALAAELAVSLGINWYSSFDSPVYKDNEYWIALDGVKGGLRGGHDICIYGASDRRQAVRLQNSWGVKYPPVWLPYTSLAQLLSEDGEASLVTDR